MINMNDLAEGDRVQLVDGRHVMIEENMQDGMWVTVRESDTSENELTHAQDVLRLVQN